MKKTLGEGDKYTTDNLNNFCLTAKQLFEKRIEREWLTTQEAAQYLSVTPNALRIMVHRNQIKAYKFGKRLRFRFNDFETLFQMKGAL